MLAETSSARQQRHPWEITKEHTGSESSPFVSHSTLHILSFCHLFNDTMDLELLRYKASHGGCSNITDVGDGYTTAKATLEMCTCINCTTENKLNRRINQLIYGGSTA